MKKPPQYFSEFFTKVERDTERNVVVYEIHLNNGTQKKTLVYDNAWKLVVTHVGGEHHTGGDHKDSVIVVANLPQVIKDSIAKYFAGYTIGKINQERRNNAVAYEVEISNASGKKVLIFDAKGHLGKEEVEKPEANPNNNSGKDHNEGVKLSEILQAAKTYISTNYAGYVVNDVTRVIKSNVITFEVEIKTEKTEKTLIFDAKWAFVKVK